MNLKTGSFNPCFLGTCPRSPMRGQRLTLKSRVSILVFLELALEVYPWGPLQGTPSSFNPCFLGTCPRSAASGEYRYGLYVFQSLFSWNLPSKFNIVDVNEKVILVSILVFLELALEATCQNDPLVSVSMFQSLFSWNLPSKQPGAAHSFSPTPCFNPCFLGTCPRRL